MRQYRVVAAAAVTGILVGAAMVASRFVIAQTAPASLAFLRYLIGSACLAPLALLGPRVRFAPRDLVPIALLGIAQFGLLIAILNFGLQTVPSGRAALLFASLPLLTMLFAAVIGQERLTSAKALGVVATIIGVGLALGEQAMRRGVEPAGWIGELAVIASALIGAVCSVLYRPYLRRYPVLPVSAIAMLASVLFLACLAAGEGFFQAWPRFTPLGWMAVVFIGLSSGIGYYLWLWALHRTTPTRVTVFLALGPVTAAGLGRVLLSEPLSIPFLLGLVWVAFGLWLSHREPAAR